MSPGLNLRLLSLDINNGSVPVVQGGMHWVGYAELAAAVSDAGGLGMVCLQNWLPNTGAPGLTYTFRLPLLPNPRLKISAARFANAAP